jgi:hypothetical protein
MRLAIVACLVLAGCMSAEQREAHRQWERDKAAAQAAWAQTPEGQAEANCRTRVQFAMAGFRDPTILGLNAAARGNQLHAECMDYWRRTGQMP